MENNCSYWLTRIRHQSKNINHEYINDTSKKHDNVRALKPTYDMENNCLY